MKKIITLGTIIFMMMALVGWKKYQGEHNAAAVEISVATQGMLADTVLASGNFIFNEQINIRPQVSGQVEQLFVEEGDYVEKGQLLMQLDPEAYQAEVERAQAEVNARKIDIESAKEQLDNLEKQLVRKQTLLAKGLEQQEVVDDLDSKVDVASIQVRASVANLERSQAALKFVQDQLAKTSFIAPMSGLVSSLDIKEGETVIAGTTNVIGSDLMTIADPSVILAEIRVDEADISRVTINQPVEIYSAAWPKHPFTGRVTKIGTSAKRLGQSPGLAFSVKVLMDETDFALFPGMSCRAEIITHQGDATTNVPIAAVLYEDEQPYVWQVKSDSVYRTEVSLGMASDTEQAVITGLKPGDNVVVGPARTVSQLQEKDKIATNKAQTSQQEQS